MPKTSQADRDAMLAGFKAPKVVAKDGHIFANARGGPYKYGDPMPCTRINLLAIEEGLL